LAPRLKKGYHQIWEANLQPKNVQSWPQVFLALILSVKRALDDINQTVIQAKREFENIQV
jgi:hypothetical protein